MYFPDVMVDVETTGTSIDYAHILQIAAVRFNLETGEIDTSSMYNRSMLPTTPHRFWDEDTRQWWGRQKEGLLESIMENAFPPQNVMPEFQLWAAQTPSDRPIRFWSKPLSFDYPLVSSYFKQYQIANPFAYWAARDVNTYIEAKGHDPKPFWKEIEFEGDAHNALFDVLHQIKGLLKA